MALTLVRSSNVDTLLGPGGALQAALPAYEHRPEQLQMARAVERAFSERSYLLAEAGTGTGKTLAYLVPALLSGRRVVVSTATKTLQDQIFFKDLPLLRDRMGLKFEAAYLKGRGNYLCLQRFNAFSKDPTFGSREEVRYWPMIQSWAGRTETGDRAELELPENFSAWSRLSATADTCVGTKCPLYEQCFVTRMRREAESADLLVVNHHLFFADLSLRGAGGRRSEGVLPLYESVIFDEAHALEDAASGYFGCSVSNHRLEELSRDAVASLPETDSRFPTLRALAARVRTHAEVFFTQAPRVLGLAGTEGGVALKADRMAQLASPLEQVRQSLVALALLHRERARAGAAGPGAPQRGDGRGADLPGEGGVHGPRVLGGAARARRVPAREPHRRGQGAARAALRRGGHGGVHVGDAWRRRAASTTSRGGWGCTTTRACRWRRCGRSRCPAPSTSRSRRRSTCPRTCRIRRCPASSRRRRRRSSGCARCPAAGPSCSSPRLRNMERAHELTKSRLPYQVLKQGERPKQQLLEAFREMPSVLFAAHSFWEGVDVPGDALSLLIIDRLPFASPGDPLVAARIRQIESRGRGGLRAVPAAAGDAGAAPGLRAAHPDAADRGAVALLDRRIVTKPYGRAFLAEPAAGAARGGSGRAAALVPGRRELSQSSSPSGRGTG